MNCPEGKESQVSTVQGESYESYKERQLVDVRRISQIQSEVQILNQDSGQKEGLGIENTSAQLEV